MKALSSSESGHIITRDVTALGSRGIGMLGFGSGGEGGLQLTFAAAAGFAGLVLGIAVRGRPRG